MQARGRQPPSLEAGRDDCLAARDPRRVILPATAAALVWQGAVEEDEDENDRPTPYPDGRIGALQRTPFGVRPAHALVPRGVYRFTTSEESEAWMTRTMTRNAREPQVEDLARICRALNDASARYLLIGGFALIVRGGARTTKDIDFLIDPAPDNIARVRHALRLSSKTRRSTTWHTMLSRNDAVVRVADEVVVDLMGVASGVDYKAAMHDAETLSIGGVPVPVPSVPTLIRTKNTMRPSDDADRQYLQVLLEAAHR